MECLFAIRGSDSRYFTPQTAFFVFHFENNFFSVSKIYDLFERFKKETAVLEPLVFYTLFFSSLCHIVNFNSFEQQNIHWKFWNINSDFIFRLYNIIQYFGYKIIKYDQ